MDQTERASAKEKILEAMKKTQQDILEYTELCKPISPENALGRISRMDAINNKTMNENALRKAKVRLKNLELVLSKIQTPDFGTCSQCKQAIPFGRILLVPQSSKCVRCAN